MVKSRVFWQVFGGYVLVAVLLASVLAFFVLNTVRNQHVRTLKSGLEDQAASIAELVRAMLGDGGRGRDWSRAELDSVVRRLGQETDTRITVISTTGVVLADSKLDASTMENHAGRPEVIQAVGGRTGSSTRHSRSVGAEMLYVAVPVRAASGVTAVVRVSLFLTQVNALLARLRRQVALAAAVLVLLSLLVAVWFVRSLSRPIQDLVTASRKVGQGDFEVRVAAESRGELGELAGSFNEMVTRLRELVQDQARRHEALATIIDSIREGLFVLDQSGRVVLANRAFQETVHQNQVVGKHYWELIRAAGLANLIKRAAQDKQPGTTELEHDGQRFVTSVVQLEKSGETVVTFHDVTEIANMARMKKDLVVNVSHELRTPLTAIKGFIETMEETASDENRRYLEIVGRHTERLQSIVKDLLLLAELEEKGIEPKPEPVDFTGLVENVLKTFERRFAEKGLVLKYEPEPDVGRVVVDPFKVEQVFINLVDNALKYTDEGEVRVSVGRHEGDIVVRVKDTGIGIPKEQLPRVFERFFVTDKARSRKLGGTGLGLSIVKHIVLLHRGTVDVVSEPGAGTEFTVILPAGQS